MHPSDRVRSALAEGRQAYIAVDTKNGPHVTPELYAWSDGALWIAAASTTLKARALRERPYAAAVVRLAGRDVAMTGHVESFDPRKPLGLARRLPDAATALAAGARYAVRNAPDLLAFVGDTVTGKIGKRVPPARVLFRLEPDRLVLTEEDTIVESVGWRTPDRNGTAIPAGGRRCVAAFEGPVAVPCRWFPDEERIFVPPDVLALADPPKRSPIGFVVDEYTAPGPAAKWGRLHRGTAERADDAGYLDVTSARVVEWDGVDVASSAG